MNWLFLPTLILAILLYVAGKQLARRRIATLALGTIIAVPGLLMALYYLHLFDGAAWYYEFRSWPFVELSAAGCGFLGGVLVGSMRRPKWFAVSLVWAGLAFTLALPYAKPILRPLPASSFRDRWIDGVCLQSTPSSCGAASAATVLKSLGIQAKETELAKECFTYRGGTENWYIARALRRRGCQAKFRVEDGFPNDAKLPMIAGVRVRKFGHFIAILGKKNGIYECADPLIGRKDVPESQIRNEFDFTGFFMEISRPK